MIVYLQGILHEINSDSVTLLTGGVGYQVFVSKNTLGQLVEAGERLELKIHTVVREDSFQLFGFKNLSEKHLFLKLIQVSNVGPKLAMTILSGMPTRALAEAISREDLVRLTAIPGIGKKTAERLIVELKDKIIDILANSGESLAELIREKEAPLDSTAEEALSALMNLGYSRQEAQKALKAIPSTQDLTLEALLRESLKALS